MLNNMGEERIDDNSEDSSYEDFQDEPEDKGKISIYITRKFIV